MLSREREKECRECSPVTPIKNMTQKNAITSGCHNYRVFNYYFVLRRHPCRRIGMRTIEECDIISPEAESRPKKSDLIIVLSRKRNKQSKSEKRPYYDGRRRFWKVEFADRDPEEGDLLYVASEYARTGLCFPYRMQMENTQ